MCRREKVRVIFWNIPRGKKLSRHTCGLSVNITTSSDHWLVIHAVESAEEWDLSCSISIFFFIYLVHYNMFSIWVVSDKNQIFQALLKAGQHWASVETVNSVFFSLYHHFCFPECPSTHTSLRLPPYLDWNSLGWHQQTTYSKIWIFDIKMPPAHKIENDRLIGPCWRSKHRLYACFSYYQLIFTIFPMHWANLFYRDMYTQISTSCPNTCRALFEKHPAEPPG